MTAAKRNIKATMPLEPIEVDPAPSAYEVAVSRINEAQDIGLAIAFNHKDHGRVAGTIMSMRRLGSDNVHRLPDFEVWVRGRTGTVAIIKLLESKAQIYHSMSEADEDIKMHMNHDSRI